MGFDSFNRHRSKAIAFGAVVAGGLLGRELVDKPSPSQTADAAEVAASPESSQHTSAATDRRVYREPNGESSDALTEPITEDFKPDFRKMNFQVSDLTDLTRMYKPAPGYEDQNWNPNGAYDEYLRSAQEADTRLKEEYKDIASHITVQAEPEWLHFTSIDEFGGIDLAYEIIPPTAEESRWGISEYDEAGGGYETNWSPTPYENVGDIKDHVLRLVKSRIQVEASRYKLDEPAE